MEEKVAPNVNKDVEKIWERFRDNVLIGFSEDATLQMKLTFIAGVASGAMLSKKHPYELIYKAAHDASAKAEG